MKRSVVLTGIVMALLIIIQSIALFPWWAFVIPVFIFGLMITRIHPRLPAFGIGFISGFMVWCGTLLFFHLLYNGTILYRTGPGKLLIPVFSGLAGALLCGLALFAGKMLQLSFKKTVKTN